LEKNTLAGNVPDNAECIGSLAGWSVYARHGTGHWKNYKIISLRPLPKSNFWVSINVGTGRLAKNNFFSFVDNHAEYSHIAQWVQGVILSHVEKSNGGKNV